ncbi:hypothetical protein TRFO_23180 [Tritrichomonas foetus]|uniref:Uncharacterized protein n=1 Tax=Tritrichomonas foetus TaxID=1144522 RepID=A0A1J4KBR3_9EUKA|nr:hypothetical protein TRFO_23180 [Tritrichomonas foetus]|eukprot:OHT08352.1 hypothetical protein TRFO_23180 [Tritrichomonas foetus]
MRKSKVFSGRTKNENCSHVNNATNDDINSSENFQAQKIKYYRDQRKSSNQKSSPHKNENSSSPKQYDSFWNQEFNPALTSFLQNISKESHQEIETLNEVVQELKKLKNRTTENDSFKSSSNNFIEQFNSQFNVSTSSIDEVLDIIERIRSSRNNSPVKQLPENPKEKGNQELKNQTNKNNKMKQQTKISNSPQSYKSSSSSRPTKKTSKPSNRNNESNYSSNVSSYYQSYKSSPISSSNSPSKTNTSRNTTPSYSPQSSKSQLPSSPNNYSGNSDSNDEFSVLKERIEFLEKEKSHLTSEVSKYKKQFNVMKKENETQSNKIEVLSNKLSKMNESRKKLMKAYDGIEKLIKEQVQSTEEISKQRDLLSSLLQKQNLVCKTLESKYEKIVQEQTIEKLTKNHKIEINPIVPKPFQQYDNSLLNNLCQTMVDNLPMEIADEIEKIRLNQSQPIQSRITNAIVCICKNIKSSYQENEKVASKVEKLKGKLDKAKSNNTNAFKLLENELVFLQKLTESSELQNTVFFKPELRTSLTLDANSRNELMHRCINVHRFIDENIGFYTQEQTSNLTKSFDQKINTDSVFDLYNLNNFESKMRSFLSYIEKEDNPVVYDVFFAQSIMNDILQKHVSGLQSQLQFYLHQNQLQQHQIAEQTDFTKTINELNEIIQNLQRKEYKMQQRISKVFPETSNKDLCQLIKMILNLYQKQKDELSEVPEIIESKISDIKTYYESQLGKLNEKQDGMRTLIVKQKEEIEKLTFESNKNKVIKKEFERSKNNINNLQKINSELTQTVNSLREQYGKQFSQFKSKLQNQLESIINYKKLNEKDQKTIVHLIQEKESMKNKMKKNNQCFEAATIKLKNIIDHLQKQVSQLEDEAGEMKSEMTRIVSQNKEYKSTNNQLKQDNETLRVAKRSLEIKLNTTHQTFEKEKFDNEIQMKAKLTTCQNEFDSKIKEEKEKNAEQVKFLYDTAARYLDLDGFKDSENINPHTVIKSLAHLIDNLKNQQDQFFSVVSDVKQVQQILNLDDDSLIAGKVTSMNHELIEVKDRLKYTEDKLSQVEKQYNKLSSKKDSLQNSATSLNQWETWARRIHGVASQTVCTTFSPNQLRYSLEEMILSSIQQRTLLYRINILREEKKTFVRFPKTLLTERVRAVPTLRAVMSVCFGVRRIQRVSGCIPLGFDQVPIQKKL